MAIKNIRWLKQKFLGANEDRAHTRLSVKLRVLVMAGAKFHGSYTDDISLGGLKLDSPIPWLTEETTCQIFIFAQDQRNNLEFRAKILSTPADPLRIAFINIDPKRQKQLQEWIDAALVRQLKEIKSA